MAGLPPSTTPEKMDLGILTNSTHVMELHTVVTCVAIVLPFGMLAVLTNVALLMSTRWKRSICRLQYGLAYCLAASNLLFCVVWAPLDLIRIIMEYLNVGLNAINCHLDIALQYFCLTIIVLVHVFLVVQHVHYISKPTDAGGDNTIVIGLVSCPMVAVGVAVVVTFQYKESTDRLACMATSAVPLPYFNFYPVPVGMVIVNCIWLLLLMIALGELIITLVKQKYRLMDIHHSKGKHRSDNSHSIRKCSNVNDGTSKEYEKSISEGYSSGRSRDNSSPKTQRNTFTHAYLHKHIGWKNSRDRQPATNDESNVDDDEFDKKMKLQLQKSLSGRRHTVANIGLGDSAFATTSKDRTNKKNDADPSFNYQYVRKWSVDIQALQEQLHNPKKSQTVSNPFRSLSRLEEVEDNKKEAERMKTEERVMFKDEKEIIKSSAREKDVNMIEEEEEESDTCNYESLEKTNTANEKQLDDKKEIATSSSTMLPPTDDDKGKNCSSDHDEEASQCLLSVDSITAPFNSISVIQNAKQTMEQEDEKKQLILQEKQRILITEQLHTVRMCLVLVLLVICNTLPFIVMQILAGTSLMSLPLNRNLSTIFGTACVIQCALQPILIAWMQNQMWQALQRLHIKLAQFKCVCYCNIGKRQQCVSRNTT